MFRWTRQTLFGTRWIELTDCNNKTHVRRLKWDATGAPYAHYIPLTEARVFLKDGGFTTGYSYITTWKYYKPVPFETAVHNIGAILGFIKGMISYLRRPKRFPKDRDLTSR